MRSENTTQDFRLQKEVKVKKKKKKKDNNIFPGFVYTCLPPEGAVMQVYQSAQPHGPWPSGERISLRFKHHIGTHLLPFLQMLQGLWTLNTPFEVSSLLLSTEPVAETFIVEVWMLRQAIYQEIPKPSQMALNCPNVVLEWAVIWNDLQSVSRDLSEVAYINVQRITFLVIACALYKVLGVLGQKKNVLVYHLWQLLGSDH